MIPRRWSWIRRIAGLMLGLVLATVSASSAYADPPSLPAQDPPTGNPALDNIWYGAVPPNGQNASVIVFVHGLGGIASDWWTGDLQIQGPNDMYSLAYAAGYRTAFVTLNLNGQRGPGNDMWVNGQTFSQQLSGITHRYGVGQVDIVAHSKGGIDAQTAIVYYGSGPLVRNVLTLSTPHQGAEIADFAAAFTAQNSLLSGFGISLDDSVKTLSPTYMAQYRAQTDAIVTGSNPPAGVAAVHWYCAVGTDDQPDNSVLNYIQGYLQQFGPNDSMITVASSCLPYAKQLFIQPYHHFIMNVGHNSFPWIQAVLQGYVADTPSLPLLAGLSGGAMGSLR